MNLTERLNIWHGIRANVVARIEANWNHLKHADADVRARIQADEQMRLRQANGFITMYEAKLAQQAS